MSAQLSASPAPASTLPAGALRITGRIRGARQHTSRDGVVGHYTLVTLPAPDSYSLPSVLEVSSTRPLGRPGEDVTVTVALHGIPRTATSKPDARGHVQQWDTATNLIRAVE